MRRQTRRLRVRYCMNPVPDSSAECQHTHISQTTHGVWADHSWGSVLFAMFLTQPGRARATDLCLPEDSATVARRSCTLGSLLSAAADSATIWCTFTRNALHARTAGSYSWTCGPSSMLARKSSARPRLRSASSAGGTGTTTGTRAAPPVMRLSSARSTSSSSGGPTTSSTLPAQSATPTSRRSRPSCRVVGSKWLFWCGRPGANFSRRATLYPAHASNFYAAVNGPSVWSAAC